MALKISNGTVRIEKQIGTDMLVQTTAIKPGSRFADETSVVGLSTAHGVRLLGNNPEVMKKFQGMDKIEAATK